MPAGDAPQLLGDLRRDVAFLASPAGGGRAGLEGDRWRLGALELAAPVVLVPTEAVAAEQPLLPGCEVGVLPARRREARPRPHGRGVGPGELLEEDPARPRVGDEVMQVE